MQDSRSSASLILAGDQPSISCLHTQQRSYKLMGMPCCQLGCKAKDLEGPTPQKGFPLKRLTVAILS